MASKLEQRDKELLNAHITKRVGQKPYEDGLWGSQGNRDFTYFEIYIKSDIRDIIKKKNKFFYKGNYKNVVGKNLKAEFPRSPNITIENNFKKSVNKLSRELIKKF